MSASINIPNGSKSSRISPVGRVSSFVANAAEVLRHGGLETGETGAPYNVVSESAMYRLRRYFPDAEANRPVVVLVPPMMFVAEVYDVSSSSSAVTVLHENGVDPWVIDFGAPEHQDGGLQRTLTDHIKAVSEAVDHVVELTGRDVHLGGYSQGGVFSYAVAAYRKGHGLASILSFGSPVDTRSVGIFSLPAPAMEFAAHHAGALLGPTGLPGWATREGFRMLDPVKTVRSQINFIRQLHDREALLPHERQRRFVESDGWIAWPAPALAEALSQFIAQNRMLSGGLVIDGKALSLADVERPILCFVGENDKIGQPQAVRAIGRAAPRADIHEVSLPVGHLGIVVGSAATASTWPAVAGWAKHLDEGSDLPPLVKHLNTDCDGAQTHGTHSPLRSAAGVGFSAGRSLVRVGAATFGTSKAVASGASTTIPRLLRLELVRPEARVSLGSLLDQRASRHPDAVGFLWEDRAFTNAALKSRIDAVVSGLLNTGVRQGDLVGVLMDSRPSMLIAVSALSRLGAVAVLMRPDGDVSQEASLGNVRRVVTDPEHADAVLKVTDVPVLVLGGSAKSRSYGDPRVTDLEAIDVSRVSSPRWFRANPGRAREIAFILFSGEGEATTVRTITNAHWARAAIGTATSAGLGPEDTIYSVNPIHHPSGLLTSLGGAVASGARFSMASQFEPETFWDEARRYGVTVVSYTWSFLRELVEAPSHPGENHHAIRTFIGSGMPPGLWHRVDERFTPDRIVEFYASTRTEAILVNMSGQKVGCKGSPLPGGPSLRLARVHESTGQLVLGSDGTAQQCRPHEIGLLLVRGEGHGSGGAQPRRGLFTAGDAWLSTGDLFYQDDAEDYWFAGSVDSVVTTDRGLVSGATVETSLGSVPAIDQCVTYAYTDADQIDLAATAVTVRHGTPLQAAALSDALGGLPPYRRPDVVHVVESISTDTSYRPTKGTFATTGPAPGEATFLLESMTGEYILVNPLQN